jgi:GNAT superfamily N-acetyltransferase
VTPADAPFTLRDAVPGDAAAKEDIRADAVRALGPAAYTPGQVEAWAASTRGVESCAAWMTARPGATTLAVAPDGRALGWSDYSFDAETRTHRIGVYVRGSAARRGVGRALFRAAQDKARAAGAAEVHCDASLVAAPFYRAMGMREVGRGAHTFRDGTALPCVFMVGRTGYSQTRNPL